MSILRWRQDKSRRPAVGAIVCLFLLPACHLDMWDGARYKPLEGSEFFEDGRSARQLPEGAVPYKAARLDAHYYQGKVNGQFAESLPARVTDSEQWDWDDPEKRRAFIKRGQNRFMVYCSPCHGALGNGQGMITERGFPNPPSYMDPRLLDAPIGYFYDVITNGFGKMYSYASRVPVEDRWAIATYIRTLQLSQNATPELLPPDLLQTAQAAPGETAAGAGEAAADEH